MSDDVGSGGDAKNAHASALASAHVPVLCDAVVGALSPQADGRYLDGTFGAGGYARALLEAGAGRVLGVDRDPTALAAAAEWAAATDGRLTLHRSRFSALDAVAHSAFGRGPTLDGVALDLGVSSMQLDQPERGFSFLRDGPLDMRMDQGADSEDETAAALIARLDEAALADLLYLFGEERASRRIARAMVEARNDAPIETTGRLAEIVAGCLPRPKPGQAHPATRSFQALRIAVNGELDELVAGLSAAERALRPGGVLAVVTFHSLEDRIVKRFLRLRAGRMPRGSRYEPELNASEDRIAPGFAPDSLSEVAPSEAEIAANPRARSARLRAATRTAAAAEAVDGAALGLPQATRSPRRRPGKRPAPRGGKGGSRGGDRRR